jgi:D-alanyl-D-alanine carboxypeptidase
MKMKQLKMKYRVVGALVAVAMAVGGLAAKAESVIPFSHDRASSVAVVIRDLATKQDLVSQNADKAMVPASTLKCFTTAAALEAGLDTVRFATHVYLEGPVENGKLQGNLVIKGIGDPTIESAQFPSNKGFINDIVRCVKAANINEIAGEIQVDASDFPDNGPCDRWELSDLKYDYGCGLYALNYRDNTAYADKAMESPMESFGEALENALNASEIVVDWEADVATHGQQQALLTHYSPRGGEIMTNLMKRSDNLFAEGMLRRLTPGQNRAAAIARERKLLANRGVNFDITDIYDGSGLSRNNRVTANVMADVLTAMAYRKGTTVSYVSLFPLVGQEGTVKKLLHGTSLEGKLALKSGSMNGVHCYAGYKLGSDGQPTHAVVILINDFFCSRDEVRTAIATFLKQQFKTTENDESDNR